jgi:multidrug efflux pump subunit AcrB
MWLTRFALTRPVITAMVFLSLTIFGIVAYFQLGRGQNPPGVEYPLVFVSASYPGASPQDMERLVIKPIEDQMQGIEHLKEMDANAQEGEADVDLTFVTGTNLDLAAIDVQRRADTARIFMPSDLDPPYVGKAGSSQPLMRIAVSSRSLDASAMSDLVTNQVQPLIEQIPNIETVTVQGTQTREFHVEPDPSKMIGLNASLPDIFSAVAANNANLPGGRMDAPTKETTVSVFAQINGAQDLAAIPLAIPNGNTGILRVGDVATASDSYVDQRYITKLDGSPRLRITMNKTLTSDMITTTQTARDRLKDIEAQFPQLSFKEVSVPADYTQRSLNGVWQSLGEGILLTAIVMLLFLHAWRNALVVMVAIPSSILATFVVMKWLGFTFDFMSLMALSLIIGILVDDSIVVLENITRHRDLGERPLDAAINGRTEIGGAAIAITMVDVIVFLPIAFLPDIVGAYLREFGLVIVIATLFSLLVSFTLTPLLAGYWSVKQRSVAPPEWLAMLKLPWFYGGMAIAAVLLWFLPWTYTHVLSIVVGALIPLCAFVNKYDAIVEAYRSKALPFAVAHGYFVIFVCGLLFVNAVLLMGGGIVAAVFDVIVLVVGLGSALILGKLYRRPFLAGKLAPFDYTQGVDSAIRLVLRHVQALVRGADGTSFAAIRNAYRFVVRSSANMYSNRGMTAATLGLPVALALFVALLPQISTDFVPNTPTGLIDMSLTYPIGTPIGTTAANVDRLVAGIIKIPGIDTATSVVGTKDAGNSSLDGGNYATLTAQTTTAQVGNTNAIIAKIRDLAALVPGGDLQVAGESGGGSGTPIEYALQGPDDQLTEAANRVVAFLKATPGSVNVQSGLLTGGPRLNINIDAGKAALLGVSPAAAAEVARMAVGGAVATKVRTSDGLVDVRVQLAANDRNSMETIKEMRVRAADGTMVPLRSLATFENTIAPTQVNRLNRQRVVNITGSILPGYSLGQVTGPLQKKFGEQGFLPAGVHLEEQGDTQLQTETFSNMGLAFLMSIGLVYMLMVILYGSFLEPLIVIVSVPMAIIGALFALSIAHTVDPAGTQSLNLLSFIGMIMLCGLVAKNGILLVDYSNTLVKRGMHVHEAVIQSAQTRFRPILMTTFAMVFGMLPLALGFAEGAAWRQAMGTVIIGGLLSSLILTLFLVPMIYNTWIGFFERLKDRRAVREEMTPIGEPVPV